ncbi:hypothetical protein TNCT_185781 [Trichonephila clavata]|uniref:Uncharacterized protein n=1 Tax=Trichonephila clavata TaxID=2740835 RepID=A0A8X6J5U1_TRICU|nr:hypothetical protein TNCT_185781 [Trichonephila clavata]
MSNSRRACRIKNCSSLQMPAMGTIQKERKLVFHKITEERVKTQLISAKIGFLKIKEIIFCPKSLLVSKSGFCMTVLSDKCMVYSRPAINIGCKANIRHKSVTVSLMGLKRNDLLNFCKLLQLNITLKLD